MRQAGRSLPEYRALRAAGGTMLDACLDPALASEITLQPVRRHGVDAAVFFSDIVVPLRLVGVDVEIAAGRGPVFPEPVRTAAEIARLVRIDPALVEERGEAVVEAVQRTTAMLAEEGERREPLPLIGFAGHRSRSPPTSSRAARRRTTSAPAASSTPTLPRGTTSRLARRGDGTLPRAAGARGRERRAAVRLVGGGARARRLPARRAARIRGRAGARARRRREGLAVPLIHFGVGTGEILADMASIGVDALGVDYRVPSMTRSPASARRHVQGNLDPHCLFAPADVRRRGARRHGGPRRARMFNLGHGVPMDTDRTCSPTSCAPSTTGGLRDGRPDTRLGDAVDVVVVGGGVAGLAVAHDLARRRGVVLEAADELGGLLAAVGSRASTSISAPSPSRPAPMPWRDSSPMPGCRSISYGRAGWRGARPRGPLRRRRRHPRPLPRRTVLGIPADPLAADVVALIGAEAAARAARNATARFRGRDARTVAVRPRRRAARSRRRRAARRHALPERLLARGARARLSELHPGLWAAFCATDT
jgi:uroporphyrinogen decarboxylase